MYININSHLSEFKIITLNLALDKGMPNLHLYTFLPVDDMILNLDCLFMIPQKQEQYHPNVVF